MELPPPPIDDRRRWMAVLARADAARLVAAWEELALDLEYEWLRAPEVGLAMVRGRAGGDGASFNLGEMTVTRCAVRIVGGATGFAWVAGRDGRHAAIAALCDALLQDPALHGRVVRRVVEPLAEDQARRREEIGRRSAATRVEFFTMARGDNPA